MAELSIKVTIASRIYPLKINISEEENVRKAAKLINEKIKDYEDNYSVRDKQDLLAMCCLQFASEIIVGESKKTIETNGLAEKVNGLDKLVSDHLAKQ